MKTLAIMVSIGERSHLSDLSFPRLKKWALKNKYDFQLLKEPYNPLNRSPHFIKLQVHHVFPGYDRYIIVDDDLLISSNAPEIEDVPDGFIGLCPDAEQRNTEAKHVTWTANTGFIVVDKNGLNYLDEAYKAGVYPYHLNDGSGLSIWGPFDQGILNHVLFTHNKIYALNPKWNYQPILDFKVNTQIGREFWHKSIVFRILFYMSLKLPIPFKIKKQINAAYGLHLISVTKPDFFNRIFQ